MGLLEKQELLLMKNTCDNFVHPRPGLHVNGIINPAFLYGVFTLKSLPFLFKGPKESLFFPLIFSFEFRIFTRLFEC